ncbi:MAG: tRNA (N(6)-L-threonylcarbamoyladenosine(37)-C(2))-methylthiotransferase MtaB [Candidatus Omnitrophota bacterium]|nr:tRNA (N(6)-L-threonylcarbamoyladenosine(37)-C(2))-methylthiotransferase MtaB [Candidatus Omnitrophota bacterium]
MNTKNSPSYRFFIKTLGCKVNQYESQAMREILVKAGFRECLSKETADIYIINTCTVTHKADTESRYWTGVFHKTNPKAKIVITGCCAEKDAGAFSFLPGISNIIKNEDKPRIAEMLTGHRRGVTPRRCATYDEPHRFLSITDFKDHAKAFVKIQDGCNNFCAYCKVPYVRGPSISKPLKDVVEEVGTLVSKGFREIVLTGICLGAWGSDFQGKLSIIDILKALNNINGDFRIRLSSIEPKYVTDEFIDFIAKNKRICRHLHIPIQSGDDQILASMNRPYTAQQLKDLIVKVKRGIEGVGITTDILVGFPGESDKSFRNTVNLIKEIQPARTHIFPFSKRDGTVACNMPEDISPDVIKSRLQRMRITAITASYLYREPFRNKSLDVLVESKREKHSGKLIGYSDNYIRVMFDGPDALMKTIVPVKIEELNLTYTLGAEKT